METEVLSGRKTFLQRWEIPVEHLDFEYLRTCKDAKEVERIVRILRSGEEGYYPDLQKYAEKRLEELNPQSKILRQETPVLTKGQVEENQWTELQKSLKIFREEVKELKECAGRIQRNLPPVRGGLTKDAVESKNEELMTKKKEKIKALEYNKWDKYDAEAEALKIDLDEERRLEYVKLQNKKNDEKAKPLITELEDVDSLSLGEKQVLSKNYKEKGNDYYRAKEYKEAIEEYTKSLKTLSTAATFNNRGMTYLKMKEYQKGLEDCNSCLEIEPANIKALLRKGQCLQGLKKPNEAYEVYLEVLKIEPENSIANTQISNLPKLESTNSTKIKITEEKKLPDVVPSHQGTSAAPPSTSQPSPNLSTSPAPTSQSKIKEKASSVKKSEKSKIQSTNNQNELLQKFKEKIKEKKKAKEAYKEHFRQMMSDEVYLLPHHNKNSKPEFIIQKSAD